MSHCASTVLRTIFILAVVPVLVFMDASSLSNLAGELLAVVLHTFLSLLAGHQTLLYRYFSTSIINLFHFLHVWSVNNFQGWEQFLGTFGVSQISTLQGIELGTLNNE